MRFQREAIILLAAGALAILACQGDPAPTSVPPTAPTRAAEPPATLSAPTAAPVVTPTSEPTTPPSSDVQEPEQPKLPAVPATPTPAPGVVHADEPQPAPTPVPNATPSPGPTPTAVPAPTPLPSPTATPAPVVEACREEYIAPIVSGPSVPDFPQDNDSVFQSLTVDPSDADTIVLGTERNGFLKSTDGGATWRRHRAGLKSEDWGYSEIWDVDISASNPDVVIAATLGSPGPPTGPGIEAGLYRSIDGGQSWLQMNCGFQTSRVTSVRLDPNNPDVAIAGLEGGNPSFTGPGSEKYYPGGIYRTEDAGENWTRVDGTEDGHLNGYWVMRVVPQDPTQLVTFGTGYNDSSVNVGFMRGTNMGSDWELVGPSMRNKPISNFDISADGQVIYANESDVYFGWVSRDGGSTWSETPNLQVNGPIAVSPADSNLVVFAAFSQIRRSTNGLQTADVVMENELAIRDIVFAPSDPNVVYAETDGYVLYRSDDAGITWRQLVHGREDVLNVQS